MYDSVRSSATGLQKLVLTVEEFQDFGSLISES